MDNPHLIHTTSQESLWTFKCNKKNTEGKCDIDNTYTIENIYTGKKLSYTDEDGIVHIDFNVEYSTTKYFKQQILKNTNSELYYNSEDLYHIYIKKSNGTKLYLSYKNVIVNNNYNNSASLIFNTIPQEGFIIKQANYNLDVLTDDNKEINIAGNIINNICYNKTKTCISSNERLSLLENNFVKCLNITYEIKKLADINSRRYYLQSI